MTQPLVAAKTASDAVTTMEEVRINRCDVGSASRNAWNEERAPRGARF
jgi:hypothetical protein